MKTTIGFNEKAISLKLMIIALLCMLQSNFAQDRWSVEFRPGVNFATDKLGETTLNTGFGAEATLAYRFMPHVSIYAGWSWNKFGSDEDSGNSSLDFEETGYTYGLQLIYPLGDSKLNLLARAGGMANHIEVERDNDIISDSGHGFGWQVEGGLAIPISENWRLMPSVRYRSLNRDLKIETLTTSVDLNYISVGLGLAVTF